MNIKIKAEEDIIISLIFYFNISCLTLEYKKEECS